MSLQPITLQQLVCDGCGYVLDYDDDGEVALFTDLLEVDSAVERSEWTTDGEGKHHCSTRPRLELTEAGRLNRMRALGPGDITFDDAAKASVMPYSLGDWVQDAEGVWWVLEETNIMGYQIMWRKKGEHTWVHFEGLTGPLAPGDVEGDCAHPKRTSYGTQCAACGKVLPAVTA